MYCVDIACVVWLFRVSVCLCVWPGRIASSLVCFLFCLFLPACASGQAELSVFLSLSCAVVVVSRRLVCFSRLSDTSGVCVLVGVWSRRPWPWFSLSVSLSLPALSEFGWGGVVVVLCLCRVAACVCCYSYIGLFATIGLRVKLYL